MPNTLANQSKKMSSKTKITKKGSKGTKDNSKRRVIKRATKQEEPEQKDDRKVENISMNNYYENVLGLKFLSGDNNKLTTDNIFRVLDLHFSKEFYTYRHLHKSYDKFIDDTIPRFLTESEHIIEEFVTEDKLIRHKFKFENVRADSPKLSNGTDPMFPADARHLGLTYAMIIYTDMTQIKEVVEINATGKNKTTSMIIGKTEKNRPTLIMPVMVRSKYCNLNIYKEETRDECKYDPGGYFIVNGSEKIVICQDRMIHNSPMVFIKKNSNISYYVVQVNSKSTRPDGMTQSVSIKIKKDNVMMIKIPFLQEVNVMTVLRALGIESDREIIELCAYDKRDYHMVEVLRASLDSCFDDEEEQKIQTQEQAIDYLITKMKDIKTYTESNQKTKLEQKKLHLMDLFKKSLLPHVGTTTSTKNPYIEKAYYIGYMINKLMNVRMTRSALDNRDSYCNKRVDNIRDLFEEILIQQYKNNMAECTKQFMSRIGEDYNSPETHNVIYQFKAGTFEQGFKASLMLGNWPRKKGVSQMLQRYSYMQLLTFLSRIDSQGGSQSASKLTKPRQLDPSSVPFLCAVQTPEHAKIGMIKHLSMLGSITIGNNENTEIVREFIMKYSDVKRVYDVPIQDIKNMYKVFLNGEWLGVISNKYNVGDKYDSNPLMKFYSIAKFKKISGVFDPESTSIAFDHTKLEIRFWTDSGRLYRPVFRVNGDNEVMITKDMINRISLKKTDTGKIHDWNEFCMQEPYPIEFIDSEEQPFMMIAEDLKTLNNERQKIINKKKEKFTGDESKIVNRYDDNFFLRYDYVEMHPSVLLGEIATNIPFCNRNQAPRNIHQYAQGKQGMGIYCTTYRSRTDISYVLYSPEVPLVNTRTSKYTYTDVLPPGSNAIVQIGCYTGLMI